MSMILDAMKRSKVGDERGSAVPTVDTVHELPEPEPRLYHRGIALWGLFFLVAAGVVIVSMDLFQTKTAEMPVEEDTTTAPIITQGLPSNADEKPSEQDVNLSPPVQSRPAVAAKPSHGVEEVKAVTAGSSTSTPITRGSVIAPVKQSPGVEKTSEATRHTDELKAIYRALNTQLNAQNVSDETGIGDAPNQQKRNDSDGSDFGQDLVEQDLTEAPGVDFADILAAAQEELGVTPLVRRKEPLLETLSQRVKDDIPSLRYSQHNFVPSGSSSVTLNGKLLRERQRVGPFTVVEILPDSVILRWRETEFRVRARNSWVNL